MSDDPHVSIGTVKRDISELANRVAFGGERIVITSRGNPKVVLVSLEDYERLRRDATGRLPRDEQYARALALAGKYAGPADLSADHDRHLADAYGDAAEDAA